MTAPQSFPFYCNDVRNSCSVGDLSGRSYITSTHVLPTDGLQNSRLRSRWFMAEQFFFFTLSPGYPLANILPNVSLWGRRRRTYYTIFFQDWRIPSENHPLYRRPVVQSVHMLNRRSPDVCQKRHLPAPVSIPPPKPSFFHASQIC